jgi:hypothetical protein
MDRYLKSLLKKSCGALVKEVDKWEQEERFSSSSTGDRWGMKDTGDSQHPTVAQDNKASTVFFPCSR